VLPFQIAGQAMPAVEKVNRPKGEGAATYGLPQLVYSTPLGAVPAQTQVVDKKNAISPIAIYAKVLQPARRFFAKVVYLDPHEYQSTWLGDGRWNLVVRLQMKVAAGD